jgi:hypothetical protein
MESQPSGPDSLVDRLCKLGLKCEDVPLGHINSAIAALACFPMYMVANVHAWTGDRQFKVPVIDFPGFEAMREAIAIGKHEGPLDLAPEHRAALGTMLSAPKAADRVIYEYALETLRRFLESADTDVAVATRAAVAQGVVEVAKASGKGLFGAGPKVSSQERECITEIAHALDLHRDEAVNAVLLTLDDY